MSSEDGNKGLSNLISPAAFTKGLGIVALIYVLLFGWIAVNGDKTEKAILEQMAARSATIEKDRTATAANTHTHPADQKPHMPSASEDTQFSGSSLAIPQIYADGGLAAAPIEGLYEKTTDGLLPITNHDEKSTPFRAYRRPFDHYASDNPVIVLFILDVGLSLAATESAIRTMPPEISFALSPYTKEAHLWANEARAKGHEVWMELPLETYDYPTQDTGAQTIMLALGSKKMQRRLHWTLSRAAGYVGVVARPGHAFAKRPNELRPILGEVYTRGLGFIDMAADPSMAAEVMAHGMSAPFSDTDVWIDEKLNKDSLAARFTELEKKATEQGIAVGFIRPYPLSYIETLNWVKTLPDKGYRLAPLSAATGF